MNDKSMVSFYKNVFDKKGTPVSASSILADIRDGKWEKQITKLRMIPDGKAQKAFKNTLPCYTPSGLFSERNAESLESHSSVLLLDFDPKDNPCLVENFKEIRNKLIANPHTHYLFESCRGNGIALGVKIDPAKHLENFLFLERYYRENFGLVVDKGCKDVCRLRYVSYDPELFINEKAAFVVPVPCEAKPAIVDVGSRAHSTKEWNKTEAEVMADIIDSGVVLVPDHKHDVRVRIALALSSAFGEGGRKYIHAIMSKAKDYDYETTDKHYSELHKNNKQKVSFRTIIHLAKEAGYKTNGANSLMEGRNMPELNLSDPFLGLSEKEVARLLGEDTAESKAGDIVDKVDVAYSSKNNILDEIPIPEFPLDVFPLEFQQYVSSASNSIGIDPGAYATMAMATLSSCIGNSTKIYAKRDFGVTPFLWGGIVIRTGSSKTPALAEATKPLKMMQSASYREYIQKMEIYEREFDAYHKDKKGTITRPIPPVLNHLYVSDATVESLADVFESQPRGVLNIQDELSGFILGLNQYKKNGNDKQQFLSIYNCDSMKIDRKGRNRVIPNTGMAIVGGIQPGVLPKVFEEDSFIDGFIQRFLFVYPDSTTPAEFSRHSIPDDEQQYWGRMVNWFLEIPLEMHEITGMVKPMAITLSPEALDRWVVFYNEYAHLQTVLPERLAGFLPKLHLYSLKLALILHVIEGFTKHRHIVTEVTVIHAIKLTNYFLGQVKKITKIYCGKKEVNEQQQRLLKLLYTLKDKVINGGLLFSLISEEYNKGLPDYVHLKPKTISNILCKDLGFITYKSTGNHSFLLWDETKLNSLYRETVTSVTSVTTETPKTDDEPFNGQF